jgi:hypothetical protein
VTSGDAAVGFPYTWVESAGGVARTEVGDLDVVVFVTSQGIHAFEAPEFSFEPAGTEDSFAGDATTWDGATGESDDGRRLSRIPSQRLFAFTWQDDHGADSFYDPR